MGAKNDQPGGGADETTFSLFLCGDVMTGRGIDQALPHPCGPRIFESYMKSAGGYIRIAEEANGPIPAPVEFSYIWGDALDELDRRQINHRIINLETAVTRSDDAVAKGINYRMSPENFPCITAAGIDCCVLANNHVLDWGEAGLVETLETIEGAGIAVSGAGRDADAAVQPVTLSLRGGGRLLVFAAAHESSGVPRYWAAGRGRPGVHRLPDLSAGTARELAEGINGVRQSNDRVVVSLHWGGNWGYHVPDEQRRFAHALIDSGAVIGGHEVVRPDLVLMYLPELRKSDGALMRLTMVPFRIRNFRLNHASAEDAAWLAEVLDLQCRGFGAKVRLGQDETLMLV